MTSNIITSKGGSQFHPMISVVLFISCVLALSSGNWILLGVLLVLTFITWFMDKTIKIDLDARKYKDGIFSTWDDLSVGGYVSVFTESSSQKIQAARQSTEVKSKELRLNYIQGKHKKHIYTAKTMEDAVAIANRLADAWDVGIYEAKSREWLREKAI